MEAADIGVRLAQYGAVLSLFGLAAFGAYAPEASAVLPRRGLIGLALVGLLAGIASILVLAAKMSGDVAGATDPSTLWSVISGTGAGRAWAVRILALAASASVAGFRRSGPVVVCSAIAAASLAWSGHASAEEGAFGIVRLASDVLHLLAAGVWIGALVAFVRLVGCGGDAATTGRALAEFSGVGSAVVAVLISSGLINAAHMVDWRPLPVLTTSLWGWLLLVKLALFAVMLGLAAAHRLVLTPRLREAESSGAAAQLSYLQRSLGAETALGFGVIALVSVLGTLNPPAGG